ncbi:MAG: ATP-binding protein [Candidatus Binatia bacterium]
MADITNWSHLEVMRALLYQDVDKELARFLEHAAGEHQIYRGIACVGVDGQVIASAGITGPLAVSGPPARSRISVVSLGNDGGEPTLRLEAAVTNPEQPGRTIGTLLLLLDRQRVLDTVGASVPPSRTPPSLTVRTSAGDTIVATGDPSQRRSGQPALWGIASVGRLSTADGPDLEVAVAEPMHVALAPAIELRATLLTVGLLVLLVSSGFGALVAWRISAPIARLTATVREITAHRQLEGEFELPRGAGEVGVLAAAFQSMLESLRAAHAEAAVQSRRAFLGEIAANVAHEVRTPLSVLKTSAQLLARQHLPPAEQRRLAANVAAEVDRLNGVVTSLVDLARPTRARYRSESLAAIVEKAVLFFAPQAVRLGVEIEQAARDGSLRVYGNADQLHQVLLNVIHNALQAMAGPGRLGIGCHRDGTWGVVEVTDTGPGFSPDALAKAFSPFCSTKPDGAGLGLAISKRIIEEHGGTIAVDNRVGGGACLRIRLPDRPEAV